MFKFRSGVRHLEFILTASGVFRGRAVGAAALLSKQGAVVTSRDCNTGVLF